MVDTHDAVRTSSVVQGSVLQIMASGLRYLFQRCQHLSLLAPSPTCAETLFQSLPNKDTASTSSASFSSFQKLLRPILVRPAASSAEALTGMPGAGGGAEDKEEEAAVAPLCTGSEAAEEEPSKASASSSVLLRLPLRPA
jgi:hypothetical protein